MTKNIIILAVTVFFVPLILLVTSSSLWQGEIEIVESFLPNDQNCNTDYDCSLVDRECGTYSCDYPLSETNLEAYYEIKKAVCMRPNELHSDRAIRKCDHVAYCNSGVCSAKPITSL